MAKNNFKELEKMLAQNKDFTFNKVKQNLISSRNIFGFLGDLIEHFLPRIFHIFISFSAESKINSKYPHEGGKQS